MTLAHPPFWGYSPVCKVTKVILHGIVSLTHGVVFPDPFNSLDARAGAASYGIEMRHQQRALGGGATSAWERDFFTDNLLVRIHYNVVMMR